VACRSRETRARSYRIVVRGSACEAASWTSRNGTPAFERGSDEGVAQGVRADGLVDAGAAGDAAHDAAGAVPVHALTIGVAGRIGPSSRCAPDVGARLTPLEYAEYVSGRCATSDTGVAICVAVCGRTQRFFFCVAGPRRTGRGPLGSRWHFTRQPLLDDTDGMLHGLAEPHRDDRGVRHPGPGCKINASFSHRK
jgi:hypothetical protein